MACTVNPTLITLCHGHWAQDPIRATDIATRREVTLRPGITHRARILAHLGASPAEPEHCHQGNIPAELTGTVIIDGFRFTLRPGRHCGPVQGPWTAWGSPPARPRDIGRRPHRLFVTCPCCEREIPIGRLQQHAGKGLGRKARKANGRFTYVSR